MRIDHIKLTTQVAIATTRDPTLRIRDLGDAAGWTERRFYQLMEGKSTNINPRIGEAIAKKLKCKVSEIII